MAFTFEDMERFAAEAWGWRGTSTVRTWREFNDLYFAGELQPVPIVLTYTQPFGRRMAFCSYSPTVPLGVAGILQRQRNANFGRTITVNVPQAGKFLVADNATLLHEMIHQYLFERGESASHDSEPWRREITRLHLAQTSEEIWAGRSKTIRRGGKVVRINEPHPGTGVPSVTQKWIAGWPPAGINLGKPGAEARIEPVGTTDAAADTEEELYITPDPQDLSPP